jgi:hypothetical protein
MLFREKNLAPEPAFRAYHYLLYDVAVYIRNCYQRMSEEQLSDLGNAIHNIPQFLVEYGPWDNATFRKRYLEPYDHKWAREGTLCLIKCLEENEPCRREKNLAPEPIFSGYHWLLHWVALHIRNCNDRMSGEQLSNLGDAIHNIPEFLIKYGFWDDTSFRKCFLQPYDDKWAREGSLCLVKTLEEGIAKAVERDKGDQ